MAASSLADQIVHVGDLDVTLQVSDRRKSIRITVERDATLVAVIPPHADLPAVVKAIESKRRWLNAKLREHADRGGPRPPRQYVSGEGFPYLGRTYRLLVVSDGATRVALRRGRLELPRDLVPDAATNLVSWYRRVGEAWLNRRIVPWALRMGVTVSRLRVMPLGYRWGSCTSGGTVNIHWATMQLPPDLIDYVLVHELAHLKEPNHTPDFWRIVERALSDYADRLDRLNRLGPDLWLPEGE
jgi:predicted metal-dependent hydrolase